MRGGLVCWGARQLFPDLGAHQPLCGGLYLLGRLGWLVEQKPLGPGVICQWLVLVCCISEGWGVRPGRC